MSADKVLRWKKLKSESDKEYDSFDRHGTSETLAAYGDFFPFPYRFEASFVEFHAKRSNIIENQKLTFRFSMMKSVPKLKKNQAEEAIRLSLSGGHRPEAKVNSTLNDQPIDIIADDRERASEVIAFLGGIPQVSVRIERLASGDYLADRRILFERKTLQDLARSIVDGRLFKQMIRLAKAKHKAVLILEGTGKDAEDLGVRREALQGALITISLILGIPVLRSMAPAETARLIVYAALQVASLGKEGYQRPGYRPKTKKGRQLHILQGLPGVGQERALRLLAKFGSIEAVTRAGRDDLMAVEGVGAKTADRIRWAVSEQIELYGVETLLSNWSL